MAQAGRENNGPRRADRNLGRQLPLKAMRQICVRSEPPLSKETVMRRIPGIARVTVMAVIAASLVTVSVAQPPERSEGPPDRDAAEGPAGNREGRGPGGPREGRAGPGSREGRMGPGGGGPGGGGPGGGGPGGPPSPERFVEHAMKFDADGDGKLDRDELTKFAGEIQRMRGGPGGSGGGRGGPGGPGGGTGGRGPGLGGPGGPGGQGGPGGERPQRPQRPE